MRIKRVGSHTLPIPARATPGSCGFDLQAVEDFCIPPGLDSPTKVRTGFAWEIDIGTAVGAPDLGIPTTEFGLIRDRSGMASRGPFVVGGVVDGDYRGEVMVLLRNDGGNLYQGKAGDKIAQLIHCIAAIYPLVEIGADERLTETERGGGGGFGSTGV